MAQEQNQVREKELLLKAKCAQEASQQISLELRQHLMSQQQAANRYIICRYYSTCTYTFDMHYRWQRETSALTSKFEKALLDMNTKVTEERRKSKELTSKFKLQTANTERVSVITVQSLLIICPSFFSYTRKCLNRNRSS